MMKRMISILCALLLLACIGGAQEQKAESTAEKARAETAGPLYRFALTISEVEGKQQVNSRNYTVMVRPERNAPRGVLRVGSRVPVQTGKDSVQYIDVGMKVDVEGREVEGLFTGSISVEMNSIVGTEGPQAGTPVLRDLRLSTPLVLTPGKPTVIGTVDDVNSKRTFQVEVTATKLR